MNPEYDFAKTRSSVAFAEAEGKNCNIVLPNRDQLQIDIDTQEGIHTYNQNYGRFVQCVTDISHVERHASRHASEEQPYKEHITLTLDRDVDPTERILFQLMLGSDPVRELLSYYRLLNGDANPTLFFEPKNAGLLTAGLYEGEITSYDNSRNQRPADQNSD
jgi:hypothetical protein